MRPDGDGPSGPGDARHAPDTPTAFATRDGWRPASGVRPGAGDGGAPAARDNRRQGGDPSRGDASNAEDALAGGRNGTTGGEAPKMGDDMRAADAPTGLATGAHARSGCDGGREKQDIHRDGEPMPSTSSLPEPIRRPSVKDSGFPRSREGAPKLFSLRYFSPPKVSSTRLRLGGGRVLRFFALALMASTIATSYTGLRLRPLLAESAGPAAVGDAPNLNATTARVRSNDDAARVIALCTCCPEDDSECIADYSALDTAMRRMSLLAPEISYAGMHQKRGPSDPSSCEGHVERYMGVRLSRRKIDPRNATTAMEIVYSPDDYEIRCEARPRPLNESMVGLGRVGGGNEAAGVGLHVPPTRTHARRRLKDWGEVFFTSAKAQFCPEPPDPSVIHTYRSRRLTPEQHDSCTVVHYPTVIGWAERIRLKRIETGDSPIHETTLSMLTRQRSREEARQVLASKELFCVLITRTTMTDRYSVDALIRHALSRLLARTYKPCLDLTRWRGGLDRMNEHNISADVGPVDTYRIQRPFKFVIAMANEMSEGYLVEKTIHPYLAGSVAVTATPGVGKYVNADALVACSIPPGDIERVQVYYRGGLSWMPFDLPPRKWGRRANVHPVKYDPHERKPDGSWGDEPVLDFVTSQWEEALRPCVDTIAALDRDDDAYVEKLMQPYVRDGGRQSLFDGTYLAASLLRWYARAGSPLVAGLDLGDVEGVSEQTPGWGLP